MTPDALAEYIDGGLAVAVIALAVVICHRVREVLRHRRLRRVVEQADKWFASLAPPHTPADAGDPRRPASAGSASRAARP